jgi:hypothetical protein
MKREPAREACIMSTRKNFVSGVAGATGIALTTTNPAAARQSWTPPLFPLVRRPNYDYAAMMRIVNDTSPNKQLFLSNPSTMEIPGIAAVFERMANAWTAYEFTLTQSPATKKLAVAAVLISVPVVFALDDAMWKKYRIGEIFKLTDRFGAPAAANVTAPAWSNLDLSADPGDLRSIYHDYTSAALLHRGARFMVCHNAYAGVSGRVAAATGVSHAKIIDDWVAHTLPGFVVIPAGGMGVQLALEHGWKLYPVTD